MNPRNVAWTAHYRAARKKGTVEVIKRARRRRERKVERPIAGVSLEFIRAQRLLAMKKRPKLKKAPEEEAKEKKKAEKEARKKEYKMSRRREEFKTPSKAKPTAGQKKY